MGTMGMIFAKSQTWANAFLYLTVRQNVLWYTLIGEKNEIDLTPFCFSLYDHTSHA